MSDFLTTKEVAELLRLKERKVYDLSSRGEIPCVKATGKLLFPRSEIQTWMQKKGLNLESNEPRAQIVLGSHDPVFEWAMSASGAGIPTLLNGSLDGLSRYKNREGIICGIHLENSEDQGWNTEVVQSQLSTASSVLVHWAKRERGLVVSADSDINSFQDIRGKRLVSRQAQAGAQLSFEHRLNSESIELSELNPVREARGETEAALAILEGQADVAFGLRCFAERYKLGFIPVCEESFDLVIDRHAYFEPPIQALMEFTKTAAFREEAARYQGYDISQIGKILFNSAA